MTKQPQRNKEVYFLRVKKILESTRNTATTINVYGTSILIYIFGILHLPDMELSALHTKRRALLKKEGSHDLRRVIGRFYIFGGQRDIHGIRCRQRPQI